ncbi:MAG: degQ [Bacteroidetes bacterium]|nr:degQ [Bacteroidota bacterium]
MNFKKFSFTVIISVLSALGAVMAYQHFYAPVDKITYIDNNIPIRRASMAMMNTSSSQPIDFRYAASASTPCVVHVMSTFKAEPVAMKGRQPQDLFGDDFFQFFHGPNPYQQRQPQMATGSGVIVSKDGYVVTNNHVVENATDVQVVLQNNKRYKAKIVGRDPDTDIALLKLDGDNFSPIQFANSDSVLVGEWVLAVGNPFNLASTVTAGIVSAKGRNLNMMGDGEDARSSTAIESFIQTDAAVNPGNSGGALVNTNGQLVGINTAIASPTGSYAGYSFAVPSNIVNKVIFDLKQFGTAQRGFLGVTIRTLDDETAKGLGMDRPEGVYVDGVNKGSAGELGGLKNKDVIVKINGHPVVSSPELQEQVANYRPGDNISVEYIRDGKVQTTKVQLKNKYNTVSAVDNSKDVLNQLGVSVTDLSNQEKAQLGVNNGVKVTDLKDGKLAQFTNIRKGFVITQIDDQPINNVEDFVNILKEKSGKVMVEGVYPNKQESYLYAFRM